VKKEGGAVAVVGKKERGKHREHEREFLIVEENMHRPAIIIQVAREGVGGRS
jgi:hypothetical protein